MAVITFTRQNLKGPIPPGMSGIKATLTLMAISLTKGKNCYMGVLEDETFDRLMEANKSGCVAHENAQLREKLEKMALVEVAHMNEIAFLKKSNLGDTTYPLTEEEEFEEELELAEIAEMENSADEFDDFMNQENGEQHDE